VTNLGLERYFHQWWMLEQDKQRLIATTIQQCFQAAQHHKLLPSLGIKAEHLTVWQAIAPLSETSTSDFPGLDAFRPRKKSPKSSSSRQVPPTLLGKLKQKDLVEHGKFGQGTVVAVEVQDPDSKEVITIKFQEFGTKRIQITTEFCTLSLVESTC
jgi:hypothetical protein